MNMISTAGGEKKGFLARLSGKGRGRAFLILVGAALGITLLIFGGSSGKENASAYSETSESFSEYTTSVEGKIYELCSKVEGVSNVSVAVSFECGFEYVYARDNDGGKYLLVGSGNSESAVKITEKPPTIGGIGIVCKGGGDPTVQNRLINLISAAFGVSSNKIYITECS